MLQYWMKLSGSSQEFPARCLLQEGGWDSKYEPFMSRTSQRARELGLGVGGIAEHSIWSPTAPWLIPELDIELGFLEEEDEKESGGDEYFRDAASVRAKH